MNNMLIINTTFKFNIYYNIQSKSDVSGENYVYEKTRPNSEEFVLNSSVIPLGKASSLRLKSETIIKDEQDYVNKLLFYYGAEETRKKPKQFDKHTLSYRQFMGIRADFRRSEFWVQERGGTLRKNGSIYRGNFKPLELDKGEWNKNDFPSDTWGTYHCHYGNTDDYEYGFNLLTPYHSEIDYDFDSSIGISSLVVNRIDISWNSEQYYNTSIFKFSITYNYFSLLFFGIK